LSQLALPLQLQDHAVFESFWPARNEALVGILGDLGTGSDGPGYWLWGKPATGKSHLLQAVCAKLGDRSIYIPSREVKSSGGAILEGLANRQCVCLDDFDAIAADPGWELALFTLFNQMRDKGATLVIASTVSPRESGIVLADLQSRMSMLTVFQVQALQENDRLKALQLRARHRGLKLPEETANFLLSRVRRDMASLYALLDRLDAEALRAQRRLTIPFVKSVVESDSK
jgi:DnaA family protein